MGVYLFIFGCIGVGVLLWILSGVLDEVFSLSTTTITQIADAGTYIFVIGLASLAVIFLISFFKGR